MKSIGDDWLDTGLGVVEKEPNDRAGGLIRQTKIGTGRVDQRCIIGLSGNNFSVEKESWNFIVGKVSLITVSEDSHWTFRSTPEWERRDNRETGYYVREGRET